MHNLEIDVLAPRHLHAAADLLSARHAKRHARRVESTGCVDAVPAPFSQAETCYALLERQIGDKRAGGIVARRGSSIVGFLIGERQLHAPEDFASVYADPRSVGIALQGHAVAVDEDAIEIYEAMYAALSQAWVDSGLFVHTVGVSADEPDVAEAWNSLGFGRKSVCALRGLDGSGKALRVPEGVTFEKLRVDEDDVIAGFHSRLARYQTSAPMFWPYSRETDAASAEVRRSLAEHEGSVCFVARSEGRELGMLYFCPPVFISPLVSPDRSLYLWEAFFDPEYRGRRLGSALLDHSLRHLEAKGYRWCALHWVAGNPLGRTFWTSKGFEPVEYTLQRRIPETLAWARGG